MNKLEESIHTSQTQRDAEIRIKDAAISILTAKNIYITQQSINEEVKRILAGWETVAIPSKRNR